jgi:hypothetical protein
MIPLENISLFHHGVLQEVKCYLSCEERQKIFEPSIEVFRAAILPRPPQIPHTSFYPTLHPTMPNRNPSNRRRDEYSGFSFSAQAGHGAHTRIRDPMEPHTRVITTPLVVRHHLQKFFAAATVTNVASVRADVPYR